MTGNTGSLRYMAPEVALRKSYNEKVDVYSYGIMVWQMARDRVPFKGLSKTGVYMTTYTVLLYTVYIYATMMHQCVCITTTIDPYNNIVIFMPTHIEFFNTVVNGEMRPPLDKAWPTRFSRLLNACWHPDYVQRPTFKEIVDELDKLYTEARWGRSATPSTPPLPLGQGNESVKSAPPEKKEAKDRKSTWF